ncbi:hypothetical protein EDD18DRAFT_1111513 [Armillaria luteobubalina]|uniref:Uncharacterized protein n=1 Tax=Armillaria luteobubalina TaxID=153913 RepID=A0AA39TFA7_9AGAR|nr:hypothetical protein EDD18DRAFT_1111513 [Armillaria luteobubalina]
MTTILTLSYAGMRHAGWRGPRWGGLWDSARRRPPKVHTPTANDEDNGRALWGINGLSNGVPDKPNNLPMAPLPDLPLGTPTLPNICPPLPPLSPPNIEVPAPPRTPTDPMSMHLPLFEWGNMAMDPILPPDPAITCHPPTIPIPALSDILLAVQASPLPQNLITPVFDSGESNDTLLWPPIIPLAVQWPL